MSNCTVTNKGTEPIDVSNDGLIMRLSKHESSEFADTSEDHHHIVLVIEHLTFMVSLRFNILCDPSGDISL